MNHSVIAVKYEDDQMKVMHVVLFENPVSKAELLSLKEELNSDPEFHMVGRIDKDIFVIECDADLHQIVMDQLERRDDLNTRLDFVPDAS